VGQPLLLVFYQELPHRPVEEEGSDWNQRFRRKLHRFKQKVHARYFEGTLERLLTNANTEVRQAAVLALGLLGSMKINASLAQCLQDEDAVVCQLATDAMWSVWFRAESKDNNQELQRLMRLDPEKEDLENILTGYDLLLARAPAFAEAYNQRAILHFRTGNFAKAILDCEKALRLNPYHFGAASGLAQCFMKQKKLRTALRCYRRAFRLNPNLDGIIQAIESLEKILGEEGKK
jgi:tetratricopeptide (TPR) repeat protein